MARIFTEVNEERKRFPRVNDRADTDRRMPWKTLDVQLARDNFVGWINWYKRTHPDEVPTQAALAKALGITNGAVTQLLEEGATRAPQFKTLVGARNLTGIPIDTLLSEPPPRRHA